MLSGSQVGLEKEVIVNRVEQLLYQHTASEVLSAFGDVCILDEVDSTNAYLLKQPILTSQAKVCLAESQFAGRGRRGNEWQSASHKNIMLSLSWGFSRWPATITGLGLAVALLLAERLNQDYQLGVEIKWPNDLLISGEKLAGLLVDVSGSADGGCEVVIGLGLNVHQPDWSKEESAYAWTDLHSQGLSLDRNQLAGDIIADWIKLLIDFEKNGFAPMVKRWNALCAYVGKSIKLIKLGEEDIVGVMLGVDEAGALIVELPNGEPRVIVDSSLSLRLA